MRSGLVTLAFLLFAAQAICADPVLTTPHFAFHSDFDTNLNDALLAASVARKGGKPELFHSGDEVACFEKLPKSTAAAWDGAVDYYVKIVVPSGSFGREQYLVRDDLAAFDDDPQTAADREFVEIAKSVRTIAAPAYRACRWAAQDDKNRRWIAELKPRLGRDEQTIASRIEALYQKPWKGLPIRIDVVETVDWAGASTVLRDAGGGHILISTSYQGPTAFEAVFHESSHMFMAQSDPVRQALAKAASATGYRLPRDLWHVVLFYMTGEAVRPLLETRGEPPYTTMVYGIMARPGDSWAAYRKALETEWRPYVTGKRSLSEAAARLIEAIKPASQSPSPERHR